MFLNVFSLSKIWLTNLQKKFILFFIYHVEFILIYKTISKISIINCKFECTKIEVVFLLYINGVKILGFTIKI